MDFREFIEAQSTVEKLPGQTPFNLAMRRKGVLTSTDPLHSFKAPPSVKDLNIVWITGMWSGRVPGTGNYGALLKPLGYNVRMVQTQANVFAATVGRLTHGWTPNILKGFGQSHIEKNKDIYRQNVDTNPDIIIGSSQGGAVALSLAPEHPEIPMLLICPAWKIFHVHPEHINQNSILIHGVNDTEVPFEDSQYLSKKFNIPLIATPDGHLIVKGFWQIVKALQNISAKVLNNA